MGVELNISNKHLREKFITTEGESGNTTLCKHECSPPQAHGSLEDYNELC